MSKEIDFENATKALQCSDLLLQDLKSLKLSVNKSVSDLATIEIENLNKIIIQLKTLVNSLSS